MLVPHYPRGGRELLGPLTRWGPRETIAWFEAHGVQLKAEPDGRMFPITDDSATVVGCLLRACAEAGVAVETRRGVRSVERHGAAFRVTLVDGSSLAADRVLIATGGNRGSAGLTIAESMGHTIEPPVPSLFTFHCVSDVLRGLEGLSVPSAALRVPGTRLSSEGPVLVTHWGLSGPGVLRLSAWGARELNATGYKFPLQINWTGNARAVDATKCLADWREAHPKRQAATANPFGLPARLWERLVGAAGIAPTSVWTSISNESLRRLGAAVSASEFEVTGKSLNKEEFVTCGGISLREIDFRTMESRKRSGLHFAGEVLDIDGLTGGFNFQAAWTTGWHAGRAMAGAVPA